MAKKNLSHQAVAYHEAGHAAAAVHQQVRIIKATIRRTVDLKGYVEHHNSLHGAHPDVETSVRIRSQIENLVTVFFAGAIAQRPFKSRTYRHCHARSDYEKAANLAIHGVGSNKELDAYLE
jgi:ATP-dependent Zn protease